MPIGTSDPSQPYFEDSYAHAVAQHENRQSAISIHPVEGTPDAPQTTSTMPPGGSGSPAGALESPGGTGTPGKAPTQEIPDFTNQYGTPKDKEIWPERMVRGLIEGVRGGIEAAGNAVQGKLPSWATDEKGEFHTSPQMIEKAADLAELAVFGPAPWAGKLADGTLGSFAGVKSATVNKAALEKAQTLETKGVHEDVILKQTGFGKGADNRWKYEIDDSKASFDRKWADVEKGANDVPKFTNTLPKILDHPELYKAYPQLRDVRVTYDPHYPRDGAEWRGGMEQRIVMGPGARSDQGVLMHEIQHAIQDIEGFAKGGSPGTAGVDFNLKHSYAVNKLIPEATKLLEKQESGKPFTLAESFRKDYLTTVFKKYIEYQEAGNKEALAFYKKLAGETEARNTSDRLLLSAQERRELPPASTEDVLRQHQISVDRPATTSAYGVMDPETGLLIKPKSDPTVFRRAANDNPSKFEDIRDKVEKNVKEGKLSREDADNMLDELHVRNLDAYNPHDRHMIGSKEMDDLIDQSWKQMSENMKKGQVLFDERMKLLDKTGGGMSEHELARYNKLGQQQAEIEGTTWEPFREKLSPESIQYRLRQERIAMMEDKLDQAGSLMQKKDFNSADRDLVKKLLKEHEDLDKLNKR